MYVKCPSQQNTVLLIGLFIGLCLCLFLGHELHKESRVHTSLASEYSESGRMPDAL